MNDARSSGERTRTRSRLLAEFVGKRAEQIQNRYLNGDSWARAALATLRANVSRPIAADPQVWQLVFEDFPEELVGRADEPNNAERAAYIALTLFGVIMQSSDERRHVPDVGFGTAIRRTSGPPDVEGNEGPLIKRFHALGTASSFEEATYHARGLIQQLRSAKQGFDFGNFATDLYNLQFPVRADGVRLRWARDLYRFTPSNKQTESDKSES